MPFARSPSVVSVAKFRTISLGVVVASASSSNPVVVMLRKLLIGITASPAWVLVLHTRRAQSGPLWVSGRRRYEAAVLSFACPSRCPADWLGWARRADSVVCGRRGLLHHSRRPLVMLRG